MSRYSKRYQSAVATGLAIFLIVTPKSISESIFLLMSALGCLLCMIECKKKLSILSIICFIYMASVGLISYALSTNTSIVLFLVEQKIFLLPFVLYYLYRSLNITFAHSHLSVLLNFLMVYNLSILIITGFAFRYVDKLAFGSTLSIYMGIITAIAFTLAGSKLHKFLFLIFTLMSGSGTAVVILGAGHIIKNKKYFLTRVNTKTIMLLTFALIFFFIFIVYNLEFRERDILDLDKIDRFQLTSAGLQYIYYEFDFLQIIFGYGVGKDIEGIYQYFSTNASVVPWLINSRADLGFTGLVFHNEFLRIIFNFGIIGCLLVFLLFYRLVDNKTVFYIMLLASLFSSTLYVSSLIAVVFVLQRLYYLTEINS